MADKVIVVEDDDGSPPPAAASPSPSPSPSSSSKLRAQLPVATHISQSPFASARKLPHVLQAENQKLFSAFVAHCLPHTKDCTEVLTFLQSKHDKACPDFLSSVEFRNTLGRCLTRAQANRSKTFVYINELCTVLRQHAAKRRQALTKAPPGPPASPPDGPRASLKRKDKRKAREDEDGGGSAAGGENPSTSGLQVDGEGGKEEDEGAARKARRASRKQMAYLENLLKLYDEEICRLQQAELSLDDLGAEDSLHIQEHKLKRKMMKIYEKLCEMKGCNTLTGRAIEQRIPFSGTRYPEINKRIQRYINSPEARENPPDYQDVLQQVLLANERHNLCLPRKQLNQIAQEAFRETGSRMQERRQLDLAYNFGSRLTDRYKPTMDPALSDPTLLRKLRSNREVALSRLEEVITKFAVTQEDTEEQERQRRQERDRDKEARKSEKKVNGKVEVEEKEKEEEEEEEEEEDDEDDESSDPDIEEELKASAQQAEAGDEDEDEEESTRGDEQTDDQTGSVSADEEEPATGGPSPMSPLSAVPSPGDSPSQSEPALSNGNPAADSSGRVRTPPLTNGKPSSPAVVAEECDTQTANGKTPPPSPRATRSRKRKKETRLSTGSHNSKHSIHRDSEVEISLDMDVQCCGSPQKVESSRAETPSHDLVSSSEQFPPTKKLKVSVATQCDPDEIIVLSDSE